MLRRLGGHPVLDFVNTIDPRDGVVRVDYLHTFADLVDWAYRGGIVSAGERRDARREASRRRAAAGAFRRAIALREAIYALFGAVAAGQRLPPGALARLEAAYREAVAHASLTSTRAGFRWHIGFDIDAIRWRIAQQAVALLESDRVDRIKRCPGSGDCGWLFLDGSKNASRRWCSMEGCGNRSKVRRFAGRRRRTAP